jgi:hypothetical protein
MLRAFADPAGSTLLDFIEMADVFLSLLPQIY